MTTPRYKIKFESYRNDEGKIFSYYSVYVEKKFWGWCHCTRLVSAYADVYHENVTYDTEKEARSFVERMRAPLPVKEDIIL